MAGGGLLQPSPALGNAVGIATTVANVLLVSPQNTVGYQPTAIYLPSSGQSVAFSGQTQPPNGLPGLLSGTGGLPPSLLFHYEGENGAVAESDITDHYVEDNTARQDQVALKPLVVRTEGFIGELNDVAPFFLQPFQSLVDKLTVIGAYTPALTANAQLIYNEAFATYQAAANAISSIQNLGNFLTGSGGENVIGSNGSNASFNAATGQVGNNQNKQQTYFQIFLGYWQNLTTFRLQTPWAIFENMMIQRLEAVQDAETDVISTFKVTFKQIRVPNTGFGVSITPPGVQGQLNQQSATDIDLGSNAAQPAGVSLGDVMTSAGAVV